MTLYVLDTDHFSLYQKLSTRIENRRLDLTLCVSQGMIIG